MTPQTLLREGPRQPKGHNVKERLKNVGRRVAPVAKAAGAALGTVATLAFTAFAVSHYVNQ